LAKSKTLIFLVNKNQKLKKKIYLDWNIIMPVLYHLLLASIQTAEPETALILEVKPAQAD
jgi:hypothetical protein